MAGAVSSSFQIFSSLNFRNILRATPKSYRFWRLRDTFRTKSARRHLNGTGRLAPGCVLLSRREQYPCFNQGMHYAMLEAAFFYTVAA